MPTEIQIWEILDVAGKVTEIELPDNARITRSLPMAHHDNLKAEWEEIVEGHGWMTRELEINFHNVVHIRRTRPGRLAE